MSHAGNFLSEKIEKLLLDGAQLSQRLDFGLRKTEIRQNGVRVGSRVSGPQFRLLLAAIVLVMCGKLLFDLVLEPNDLYSLQILTGTGP